MWYFSGVSLSLSALLEVGIQFHLLNDCYCKGISRQCMQVHWVFSCRFLFQLESERTSKLHWVEGVIRLPVSVVAGGYSLSIYF